MEKYPPTKSSEAEVMEREPRTITDLSELVQLVQSDLRVSSIVGTFIVKKEAYLAQVAMADRLDVVDRQNLARFAKEAAVDLLDRTKVTINPDIIELF